jgi:probable F420-dependent oxidoreductase
VKFGLSTLTRGLCTTREAYQAVAGAAERAGFDFLSVSDHLVVPAQLQSAYPYAAGGAFGGEHGHCLDQLATIAFLAGATERLCLLTSVLVVPYRSAIPTAKLLASIDVLSNGRLIIGAGAGWMREEFLHLEVPFEARGGLTDEYLEAFRELWTKDRPAYRGQHVRFSDLLFYPKPMQKPHPPIWIGGESAAARRRAIRFADAWYPASNNQGRPLDTPERLRAGIAGIQAECESAGRDPALLGVSLLVQHPFEWSQRAIQDGSARALFTGSAREMQADATALAGIGVGHVAVRLGGASIAEAVERIERFGAEVISATS